MRCLRTANMSLNLTKLEKVRHLANGAVEARCPACAEGGHDRKGEHLMIKPDGRFGCCAHPKDREHRKRIFALAGDTAPRSIKVRSAVKVAGSAVQSGMLGRLGRVFASAVRVDNGPDATDGVIEVQSDLDESRTPRTGETKSVQEGQQDSRTLRTPFSFLSVREKEKEKDENTPTLKDYGEGVRSVRAVPLQIELGEGVRAVRDSQRLPHFTLGGTLVIPFDSAARFHWWKGGQSLAETRAEVESWRHEAAGKEQHGIGV